MASDLSSACASIWITRVQLPQELSQGKLPRSSIAGGRRNNPRGKRVWPLCPTAPHHIALQEALRTAAEGAELRDLTIGERFGIATFDNPKDFIT